MADFYSALSVCTPCCSFANTGSVNILLCCEKKNCRCGNKKHCKRSACRRRGKCGC